MINSYFNKIYCVNLDSRTDKWNTCVEEFKKNDLIVERVSAVDGKTLPPRGKLLPGELGCSASHANILRDVIKNGYDRVLILEDDVEFVPHVQIQFMEKIDSVPANWDMLYLGGNHIDDPVPLNRWAAKIRKTYTTSHYGITLEMAKIIVDHIEQSPLQVDVLYTHYQQKKSCYTFMPALAWQRACHSDIHNTFVDYTSRMKPKGL